MNINYTPVLKHTMALLAGLIFSFGLVLSGMTQPDKVIGFLNLMGIKKGISWIAMPGYWDPSLIVVMGSALTVTLLGFSFIFRRTMTKPWFDDRFYLPTKHMVDRKLIFGSTLFGIGWGLAGYCPGPALASLLIGRVDSLVFCIAMLFGMWIAKKWIV